MTHYVYDYRDAEGRLLYIGESDNWTRRLREHERTKAWFGDVAVVAISRVTTREEARDIERERIVAECPMHNIVHSGAPRTTPLVADRPSGARLSPLRLLSTPYGADRCSACGWPAVTWEWREPKDVHDDIVSYGCSEGTAELLCNRCSNSRAAHRFGYLDDEDAKAARKRRQDELKAYWSTHAALDELEELMDVASRYARIFSNENTVEDPRGATA